MNHVFKLDALLAQVVSTQQAKLTPPSCFATEMKAVTMSRSGEVCLDFSSTNATFFSTVAIPLIERVMQRPEAFLVSHRLPDFTTDGDALPSLVQLTIQAPTDIGNAEVIKLCDLIPVCKSYVIERKAVPSAATDRGGTAVAPTLTGAIRSIILEGCERVSLEGGRALRDAARRNTLLQVVSVYGCSINLGTGLQLARAVEANVQRMIRSAEQAGTSPAPSHHSLLDAETSASTPRQQSSLPPSRGPSVATQPTTRESSLLRDVMRYHSAHLQPKKPERHLAAYPLLQGLLTR